MPPRSPCGPARLGVLARTLPFGLLMAFAGPAVAQDSDAAPSSGVGGTSGSGATAGGPAGPGPAAPSANGAPARAMAPSPYVPAGGLGGLLPNVGASPRVGDLRSQLQGYLSPQASTAARPSWLITPSIEADLGITDNVQQIQSPRRGDVFLLVTPQIVVNGDTANITANLVYAPQFTVYANDGALDGVYQTFNGQALATLIPNSVFLDLRGAIVQSTPTGVSQVQTQAYNTQNSVQTTSFGISPYAVQQFGGWGTGTVRYQFDRTLQDSTYNQGSFNTGLNNSSQRAYGNLGNLTTNTESASFSTGENLNRVNLTASADASQYSGGLSADAGHREDANLQLTYAINHKLSLLSGIGYQVIEYGSAGAGLSGYSYSGVQYNIGFTYAPTPDTSLTVEYGRHDGSTEVNFDASFALTPRIRILARYSNGITTDLQQAQSQLNSTTVTPNGTLVDTVTGAPALNNQFGVAQNNVYRDNRFSGTVFYVQERDSYALSVGVEERKTLTSGTNYLNTGVVPAGTNTSTTYASLSWQHDLAPDMAFYANVQYGISTGTGALIGSGNQNTTSLVLSAVLTKQFTETLSGSVRYTYTDQSGAQFALGGFNNGYNTGNFTQNTFLVGLRKTF